MADKGIPTVTTREYFVVNPFVITHCNARTDYHAVVHYFNPAECDECAELIAFLGKAMRIESGPPFDAYNRHRNNSE